jgi:copper(I)-binding protein
VFRSSSGKTVARRLIIGAFALLVPAITGCEAGYSAPTLEFHAASAGAHTDFNGISISNVFVLGGPSGGSVPAGSSASMFLALYNNGTSGDKLLGIAAPGWAGSVQLTDGGVSLPASGAVNLTGPNPAVVLSDLSKPLSGGQSIPVILDFQHAGVVRLDVPVEPHSFYFSTYSQPPASPAATPATTPASTPATKPGASTSAAPSPSATPTP